MHLSRHFQEANEERRKRIYNERMRTAKNFNLRIRQFLGKDVIDNFSLSKKQKKEIIAEIFKDLKTI